MLESLLLLQIINYAGKFAFAPNRWVSRTAHNPNLQVAFIHEKCIRTLVFIWTSTKNEWNA